MRKKIILRLLLLTVFMALLWSCRSEDLLQEENPAGSSTNLSSAKYASKSLWKEDELYIGKVQEVFLKHANLERFSTTYGELSWNYAMSFGQFGEKYLLVPIVKDNKVTLMMEAVRIGSKVYFYEKRDEDLLTFFQHVMYSKIIGYREDIGETEAKAKYVCSTRTIIIGCLNGATDCEPVSYSSMVCEWKESGGGTPPKTLDPLGDPFIGGGGDGGWDYPDPPEETPCEKAIANNLKTKKLLNDTKIASAETQLTATLNTDTNEKSFSFGKDADGNYDTTPVKTSTAGNQAGISITSSTLTIEGGAHTHTTDLFNCFSTGDIYSLQGANVINENFKTLFVFADGGVAYALTITDPSKYAAFVASYSAGDHLDMATSGWKKSSPMYNVFKNVMGQFLSQGLSEDDALAYATALILNKYDTGATLSQKDASGNFNSIFVNETTINANVAGTFIPINIYNQTTDCNLN
ncbi:hypothetical protein [Chryseobacterium sp. SIMBA_029]|uniref:hypothetical protein n=1 Tax=Chryseobacterium sp. SIMBA_029 TaxID=3085772 RepID=UPI003979380B